VPPRLIVVFRTKFFCKRIKCTPVPVNLAVSAGGPRALECHPVQLAEFRL